MSSQSRSSSIHSLTAHSGSSASSASSSLGSTSLLPLFWAEIDDANKQMLAKMVVVNRMMNKRKCNERIGLRPFNGTEVVEWWCAWV
jgi:hypothetical protein